MASTQTATALKEDFAAMLDESFKKNENIEGSVIRGSVIRVDDDFVLVDVGLKSEGRIALKEFGRGGRDVDLKSGDRVDVYVERYEDRDGLIILSRDKARREEAWNVLEEMATKNSRVEGIIFGRVKGGFTVDLNGAVAFLPGSQVDIRPVRDITPLMGSPQQFQILKMDRARGNIVVSRRAVLEETRAHERSKLMEDLKEGQVLDGVVKNITEFGLFVGVDGEIDGMVHLSDIAYDQEGEAALKNFTKGQIVKAKVLDVDVEKERISLGIKQLQEDPNAAAAIDLKKGQVVTCVVKQVVENGIEVTVNGSLQGFIKRNELAKERSEQRPDRFAVGEKVDARILTIDPKNHKLTLSIKAREVEEEKAAMAEFGSADSGASLGDILGAAMKAKSDDKKKTKKDDDE